MSTEESTPLNKSFKIDLEEGTDSDEVKRTLMDSGWEQNQDLTEYNIPEGEDAGDRESLRYELEVEGKFNPAANMSFGIFMGEGRSDNVLDIHINDNYDEEIRETISDTVEDLTEYGELHMAPIPDVDADQLPSDPMERVSAYREEGVYNFLEP